MTTFRNAPLYEGLMKFAEKNPASFHVPGHRNGQVLSKYLTETPSIDERNIIEAFATLAEFDVTELSETDDLHEPEGIIKYAQQQAAQYFGADHSFFLVGGSTSGNLAIILSICNPGDLILVQRNVHKSIINGCKLAGVKVVFLTPELEHTTDLATVPSMTTIEAALKQYKEAKAAILTNPNYYGLSVKLQPYVELIHSYEIPVIVDAAHGAHFGLHKQLPQSALQANADAVVQSIHKTLPAFTMSAMLHIQGNRIDIDRLQKTLAMIESSSPSYLLMTSLDIARAMMEEKGSEWIEQALYYMKQFSKWLDESNIPLCIQTIECDDSSIEQDPFRLLIYDRSGKMNGFELQRAFEEHNVWIEMATQQYAVFVIHLSFSESDMEQLKDVFMRVAEAIEKKPHAARHQLRNGRIHYSNDESKHSLPIQMQRFMQAQAIESVSLEAAAGKVSAEMIVPYPPGIPILYEGETITAAICAQIRELIKLGAKFQGSDTIASGFIQIFAND